MAQQKWNLGDIRPARREGEREVRPRSKRPMQDVVLPGTHPSPDETGIPGEASIGSESPQRSKRHSRASSGGGRKKIVYFGVIVLALVLVGFLATLFLQGAELMVYPKFKDVAVQATFTAYQNPAVGTLGYELLTLEETGERTVAATGAEEVKEQATGEVTLYNAFSKEPQRLIKNTRFESSDGKIFRMSDSVVIPGYATNAAGENVPGTTTAKVFADAAGDVYNIAPARFTIPGLKGSPQFDTMYAESNSTMQGGFVGARLIVEEAELTRAQEAIRTELKDKLMTRLRAERPVGFEVYEAGARVRFESLPSVDAGQQQATIREKAILEAPLFAEADFARYLAQNTIVGYGDEDVRIDNPQSLMFSYINASSSQATTTANKIDFNLAGNAKIVWKYDKEKLRNDVAGAVKEELPNILLTYQPAIERATTVMRPFWRQSFPEKPEKIKIVEMLEPGR